MELGLLVRVLRVVCDERFTGDEVVDIASDVAWHWNTDHEEELYESMQQFDEETVISDREYGNTYTCHVYTYFITTYDVINANGGAPLNDE